MRKRFQQMTNSATAFPFQASFRLIFKPGVNMLRHLILLSVLIPSYSEEIADKHRTVFEEGVMFIFTGTVARNPSAKQYDNQGIWTGTGTVTIIDSGIVRASGMVKDGKMQGRWISAPSLDTINIREFKDDVQSGLNVKISRTDVDVNKYENGERSKWFAIVESEAEWTQSSGAIRQSE